VVHDLQTVVEVGELVLLGPDVSGELVGELLGNVSGRRGLVPLLLLLLLRRRGLVVLLLVAALLLLCAAGDCDFKAFCFKRIWGFCRSC
jgi:hypothetical protein